MKHFPSRSVSLRLPFLGLLLACLTSGCSDGPVTVVTSFPETHSLTASVWSVPAENYYPQAMVIHGDKLVVHNLRSDFLFQVFDVSTREFLYECGEIGRGGNDFGGEPDRASMCARPDGFGIRVNHEWYSVAVREAELRITEKLPLADVKTPVQQARPLHDGWFCAGASSGDKRNKAFVFLHPATQQEVHATPFPRRTLHADVRNASDRAQAYAKQWVVNPSGDRLAAFYARFKALQIVSDQGRVLRTVRLDITPYATAFDPQASRRYYGYISNPAADAEHIYVLCAGSEEEADYDVAATELQVFDWDGNPVAAYTLDHYVHHIAVSGRTVYAVNTFKPSEIYVYQL